MNIYIYNQKFLLISFFHPQKNSREYVYSSIKVFIEHVTKNRNYAHIQRAENVQTQS